MTAVKRNGERYYLNVIIWGEYLDSVSTYPMKQLDDRERARAGLFRTTEAHNEFVAGRVLAKAALAAVTGTTPREWRLDDGPGGRPMAVGPESADVNIAHSGGLVAVAAARGVEAPVGIDVEDTSRAIRMDRLVRRYFLQSERDAYESLTDPNQRRERFFALWSLKEAHAKATGIGLAKTISEVAFTLDDGDVNPCCSDPRVTTALSRIGGHTLAVVAPQGTEIPRMTLVNLATVAADS
jgi:4'-phosphopantetheinyl transferase